MSLAFASISTDLYLPALPAMAAALHAGVGTVELTISGYLIGFSLGQLVWGPVGDRYGRRAAQMMSILMTVMAIAPLVGPSLGGQILHVASWRAIFWPMGGVIAFLCIGSLLCALFLVPSTAVTSSEATTAC